MALYRFVVAAGLSLLGTRVAQAQPAAVPRGMTFEDVMTLKQVGDPQLSPDGRWVAYVVTTPDTVENAVTSAIWLVRADGSIPSRLWVT
jgi:hypothetical protein